MPETHENLQDLADLLGALAHASRLHILMLVLVHGGAMSAGDIAARFSHSWPTTSRHLRVLEEAGLLGFDKQGRTRVYRVNRDKLHLVRDWLRWFEQAPQAATSRVTVRPELVLREIALAYPEAQEQLSEGKRVFKVRNRPFLLLELHGPDFKVSARLHERRGAALEYPFAQAIRYRLGKSDWITAAFPVDDDIPLELLWEWIDESYRRTAPRKLLANLPAPLPNRQSSSGQRISR